MMQDFQQYQTAFSAHLRDPHRQRKPPGTDARRMTVYREIVFNNFVASVSACFPVLLQVLGKRRFRQLVRRCFHSHAFTSPLFKDIPAAFVAYLQLQDLRAQLLPPYTAQLAHYEWVELAVSRDPAVENAEPSPLSSHSDADSLRQTVLQLPAAHQLVSYDFAVHRIRGRHAQASPEPTYLLVYRRPDFSVAFTQLNGMSYQLLQHIQAEPMPAEQHLLALAQTLPAASADTIVQYGLQTLHTLLLQHALYVPRADIP